jgi:hypothetical protein
MPVRPSNLLSNDYGEKVMPKQKDIRSLLQKQIESLTENLTSSRASLVYYQSVVNQQTEELAKLNNALASLDGTLQPTPTPFLSGMREARILEKTVIQHFPFNENENRPQVVMIGGEPTILESGFHVEKNSFGEDCIVPDGVAHAPAAEPTATPDTNTRLGAGMIPLPAITSGEQFDAPEDIISQELPNG